MSYSISEIKVAAYNWTELPWTDDDERRLWYSLGFWYEEYRAGRESKEKCEEAVNGYIEHFVLKKRWDKNYTIRFK